MVLTFRNHPLQLAEIVSSESVEPCHGRHRFERCTDRYGNLWFQSHMVLQAGQAGLRRNSIATTFGVLRQLWVDGQADIRPVRSCSP